MASKTKNKYSVAVAYKKAKNTKGRYDNIERLIPYLYLSNRDIEQGYDIHLDMQGFIIEAL